MHKSHLGLGPLNVMRGSTHRGLLIFLTPQNQTLKERTKHPKVAFLSWRIGCSPTVINSDGCLRQQNFLLFAFSTDARHLVGSEDRAQAGERLLGALQGAASGALDAVALVAVFTLLNRSKLRLEPVILHAWLERMPQLSIKSG